MRVSIPRHVKLFALLALATAFILTYTTARRPTYTDAYYHFNAAERLASGEGLTDTYLWIYLGAPDLISDEGTFPSHIYWMPFTAHLAAFGMWITGSPGSYAAALWPFSLLYFGIALIGFWLGGWIGRTRRYMWLGGLLALFSGLYIRYWGQTDTFTPYAFFGSLALVWMGLGLAGFRADMQTEAPESRQSAMERGQRWWPAFWLLAGLFSGIGHLTRADGMLLGIVGLAVIWWPWDALRTQSHHIPQRIAASLLLVIGYTIIMLPWFMRNMDVIGTALPVGGTKSIWFTDYAELFNITSDTSPKTLFANGLGAFLDIRGAALIRNFATWLGIEGMIAMAPLMMVGLWTRRHDHFVRSFWLYALGLHLAMTLVFPLPGYRGGLFHSSAALVPWWGVFGAIGLDRTVDWIAKRRRTWRPASAKQVFSAALVILAISISLYSASKSNRSEEMPKLFTVLDAILPAGARVVANDPAEVYYFTKRGGAVIPNEDPAALPELAAAYDLDYLFVERIDDRMVDIPPAFDFDPLDPPPYLTPVEFENGWLFIIGRE